MDLDGKVAIVTGAAAGIGYATAKLMAEKGAKVIAADVNQEGANNLVDAIRSDGGEATSVYLDILKEESIKEMIAKTNETYGKIDILHNNVGGTTDTDRGNRVADLNADTWDLAFELSLKGTGLGCKYAIPHMIENGGGAIINTASMSGFTGDLQASAYGSVKAGVINLTRYVATQYGKQGIRCNAVAPGLIITSDKEASFPQETKNLFNRHNALDRLGKPEDIANTVVFLASEQSGYITGQTIQVDGGFGIHSSTFAEFLEMGGESRY